MARTFRLKDQRWFVHDYDEELLALEGRRVTEYDAVTLPPSLRAAKQLDALGYRVLNHGGGPAWLAQLRKKELPLYETEVVWDRKWLTTKFVKSAKFRAVRKAFPKGANIRGVYPMLSMYGQPIHLWPCFLVARQREPEEFFPWVMRYCAAKVGPGGLWDYSGASHTDELQDELALFTKVE